MLLQGVSDGVYPQQQWFPLLTLLTIITWTAATNWFQKILTQTKQKYNFGAFRRLTILKAKRKSTILIYSNILQHKMRSRSAKLKTFLLATIDRLTILNLLRQEKRQKVKTVRWKNLFKLNQWTFGTLTIFQHPTMMTMMRRVAVTKTNRRKRLNT